MNKEQLVRRCRELLIEHGKTEIDVVWLGDMSDETIQSLHDLRDSGQIRVTDPAPGGLISRFALVS